MPYALTTEVYKGKLRTFQLLVPQVESLQQLYQQSLETGSPMRFPYWGKIWPAAFALANFIDVNTGFVKHKRIIELAGGLGLPAFIASQYATQVTVSDYEPEAVALMKQSIALNNCSNIDAILVDLRQLPQPFLYEVVLLSDINYEPAAFAELYQLIIKLKAREVLILLATPQRLLAKPFVEKLLPLCQQHGIVLAGQEDISVMVI